MAESDFNAAVLDADLLGHKVRMPATQIAKLSSGETYSGQSYSLRARNLGGVLRTTSGSAVSIVVPPSSQLVASDNDIVNVLQLGAGQVTFVASAGVTINTAETLRLAKQYAAGMLINTGTDEWLLVGNLEAAV
jgi:hypothetical protein